MTWFLKEHKKAIAPKPTPYHITCFNKLDKPDPSFIKLKALYKEKQLVNPKTISINNKPISIRIVRFLNTIVCFMETPLVCKVNYNINQKI